MAGGREGSVRGGGTQGRRLRLRVPGEPDKVPAGDRARYGEHLYL